MSSRLSLRSDLTSESFAACTLLGAALLAGTAHGQTNAPVVAPATGSTNQLPTVVVTDTAPSTYKPETVASPKYTEPLRDTAQTITVIPKAVIEQRGATSLRDVLRNVPGISMQAGEGGGGLPGDNLSIRGFSSRSDIFIDGVRDYGGYSRDPFNVEQVEVVKGPSSATSGRGSTGGSVNLVSKIPFAQNSYDGTLGFGTDDYKRGTVDFNQSLAGAGLETAAIRFNGLWHEAGTPGRDVVDEKRWAVAPSVAFGLGTPTRLFISYNHMEQDNTPDYGIPWVPAGLTNGPLVAYSNEAPPVPHSNFYGIDGYDYEEISNDLVSFRIEHDFSDDLKLRSQAYYVVTDRDSAITAPRFADPNNNTLINRQLQRRQMENETFTSQTDVNYELQTGPVEHSLVGGLELSWENQKNRNGAQATNQPQTDLFFPNPNAQPLGPMPAITTPYVKGTVDTIALYAYDTLKFGDKWLLNGGLRYDHSEAKIGGFSATDDVVNWRGSLTFKPRENGSIYFAYGTSFNPSFEGNTGIGLNGQIVVLPPEETQTFELGTKWELIKERLLVSAAIFHTQKDNARTPGIAPNTTVLAGDQVVDGFELGASGNITDEWAISAGYTFLDSEIKSSGNPLEVGNEFGNTPKHSFSIWNTYQLPLGFEIGAGAQFVGDRKNGNLTTSRTAPSYVIFDAMLGYAVTKNVTLRLNVYNLADEEYIDRIGGGHFIPGTGRSAMLTASFNF